VQRHLADFAAGTIVLVNLSGRGDKDMETVRARLEERLEGGLA
jgi:tryptophan synthase beta subunit